MGLTPLSYICAIDIIANKKLLTIPHTYFMEVVIHQDLCECLIYTNTSGVYLLGFFTCLSWLRCCNVKSRGSVFPHMGDEVNSTRQTPAMCVPPEIQCEDKTV